MAFYAFVEEPPVPRTQFEIQPKKAEDVRASTFEQAMNNVLVRFPEACRAVVEEMRRLDEEEKGKGTRSP